MKKGNTVYEDKAEREEARRKKRQAQLEKHVVLCPHCGERVLDHMTQCPHCKGELVPAGYRPMSEKAQRRVKAVLWVIGIAAVVCVLVYLILKV